MKLTAAIAASYFGAEVKVNGYYNNDSTPKEIVGTMTHVGLMSIGTGGGQYSYSQCQLILTPLSKISDEDAVEVAKIAIGVDAKEPIIERCGDVRVSMDYGISRTICVIRKAANQYEHGREYFYVHNETEQGAFNTSVFGTAKIVDYLRSKGYDCGHGSIPSLIAAGVAVEKTNL